MQETQAPADLRAKHAVVFAGEDMDFAPQKRARHVFGMKLITALSCHLHVHAAITQHAMILWTVAMAKSAGYVRMCVCVGCFMLANKIQDNSTAFSLQRFARACGSLAHARGHIVRDLDAALQTGGDLMSVAAIHLKNQLKSIDELLATDAQLLVQVGSISVGDLKCVETTLLFHMLYDRLNFYLFYAIEYARSGLEHLPAAAQTDSIAQMCVL
jgi:hypothetical protein